MKNPKSEAEVVINKLRCYVQINSVAGFKATFHLTVSMRG